MTAFQRGKKGYRSIYVPTMMFGLVARSTGTSDKAVVRKMKAMVVELRDRALRTGDWSILEAVRLNRVTLVEVFVAYSGHTLAQLEAKLSGKNLADHLDGWLAWIRGNRRAGVLTPDGYWQQVTSLIPAGGTFLVTDLTKARVIAWLAEMRYQHRMVDEGQEPKGVSSGYKRKCFYALKSFIRYLLDTGVLETDPLAGLRAPKKNPPRERWETAERDRAIVAAAIPQYRAAFAFIKATGCDVGSAWRAQLGDLDLERGEVTIRGTKTDHRKVFRAELEAWAVPLLREHAKALLGHHTLLFPGLTNSGASHHHRRCCAAVGVEDYTLKDARHSVGVRMRLAGKTFEEIAQRLGTSVYQAVTVYTKYTPDAAQRARSGQ